MFLQKNCAEFRRTWPLLWTHFSKGVIGLSNFIFGFIKHWISIIFNLPEIISKYLGLARVLLQQHGQTPITEMPWNVFHSSASSTRGIITSTPIIGQRGPRSTTPVTMFPPTAPPNIPPHFGPQQQAMAAAMRRKSESPVVYAEVIFIYIYYKNIELFSSFSSKL